MSVAIGQIWADNDPRSAGRRIRIDAVGPKYAECTVVSDCPRGNSKGKRSHPRPAGWSNVGLKTRIALDRFRPTHTGYKLVDAALAEQPENTSG